MKLSPNEKLMMMYLKSISKRTKEGRLVARTVRSEIADNIDCTTRTVSNVTRKLEAKGILKVILSSNGYEKSIYHILKEEY